MTKPLTNAEILAAIDHSLRETWRELEAAKDKAGHSVRDPLHTDSKPGAEAPWIRDSNLGAQ